MLLTRAAAGAAPTPPHKTAAAVHLLSPEEAAGHRPVRLTGTVTALSGWKNSFFFQDATSGISINRESPIPALQPGDRVVVDGFTDPGAFAPQIADAQVTLLGHGSLPEALPVTAADLAWGVQDSQYVAMHGEIRSLEHRQVWGRDRLVLMVNVGAPDLVAVYLYTDKPSLDWNALVGATITARGVCGTVWNNHRQFAGLRLFANAPADIHVDAPAPADPFDAPFRKVGGLLQYGRASKGVGQLKVRGTVSALLPGSGFYLQDDSGGTFISNRADPVKVGDSVEVVGYPSIQDATPSLQAIHLRHLGQDRIFPARVASGDAVFVADRGFTTSPYESTLIEINATLLQSVSGAHGANLLLKSGGSVFEALVPDANGLADMRPGAQLRLQGVCIVSSKDNGVVNSFQLRLRSASDVTVIKAAPWWTVQHALWLSVALGIIVLAMLGWVAFLRRQARLQALVATDPLTGLYNRRGFLLLAQKQIEVLQRRHGAFLLFYFDVNRFKQINDTFGHRMGDAALREIAAILRQVFRDADVLCRLGGDEFAVLATDATRTSEDMLKSRLYDAVEALNGQSGRAYRLSLSVGSLFCHEDCLARSIEDLLETADALMYTDKRGFHPDARPMEA